jgi:hypothetical protein
VIDDPVELQQRVAYLERLRAEGRRARFAGFVACLVGVMILVIGRFRLGGAAWLLWSGLAVVALGWGCFIYAVVRRLNWARAHPFDPTAAGLHR